MRLYFILYTFAFIQDKRKVPVHILQVEYVGVEITVTVTVLN